MYSICDEHFVFWTHARVYINTCERRAVYLIHSVVYNTCYMCMSNLLLSD